MDNRLLSDAPNKCARLPCAEQIHKTWHELRDANDRAASTIRDRRWQTRMRATRRRLASFMARENSIYLYKDIFTPAFDRYA